MTPRNNMTTKWLTALALATALAMPLMAQDAAEPADTGAPAASPADQPASAPAAETDDAEARRRLAEIVDQLSPEELDALVKRAMKLILAEERKLVAAELRSGLLYDPDAVQSAIATLEKDPKDTVEDNVQRICAAFAAVDSRFAQAWKLLETGKDKEAAAAAKALVNPQLATYFGAAKYYVYGQALAQCGLGDEAADAFGEIFDRMRDRTTFASQALLRTAQTWEKLGRGMYALRTYKAYYNKYRLVLEPKDRQAMEEKIAALARDYSDPLATAAKRMGDVQKRLQAADSGAQTRQDQDRIVALLDDMIKTAEDQQSGGSSSSSSGRQPNKGRGQQEGQGNQPGQRVTRPPPPNPSSPAEASSLRLGNTVRPGEGGAEIRADESGDWAKLPPREREKMEQLKQKMLSERYRDIISDYHKRLARQLQE